MSFYNKKVFLLIDYVDLEKLDISLLEQCDKIALTPSAMLAFKEQELSYQTLEDFYAFDQFRIDNGELNKATDKLFLSLDKVYEPLLKFPRAFTGNILFFLFLFSNYFYVEEVCKKINSLYSKVYLSGSSRYKVLSEVNVDFSSKGLGLHFFSTGLINKIRMFRTCLSLECLWFDQTSEGVFSFTLNVTRWIYLLKQGPRRLLLKFQSFFELGRTKRKIFIVQDGYEVSALEKWMKKFVYVRPIEQLLLRAGNNNGGAFSLPLLFEKEIEAFSIKWFPAFKEEVVKVFIMYHQKVLSQLNSSFEDLKEIFDRHKPAALFYSIASTRVYEDMFAFIANQRGIPIFYFQHGGTHIFSKSVYLEYLEQNKHIEKINIYHSRLEEEFLSEDKSVESKAFGSIKFYEFYQKEKRKGLKNRRKKVLYCPGAFSAFNYRMLATNMSDRDVFEINKDVMEGIRNFSLKMDIKVHPSDQKYNYLYFKALNRVWGKNNIRILQGFPVETIIQDYGLLIIDQVSSALFPLATILKTPVILYLKDTSHLREEYFGDIKKQFYLARNRSDLEKYIALYSNNDLPSRFSMNFVEKYVSPMDKENPANRIAEYMDKNICSS